MCKERENSEEVGDERKIKRNRIGYEDEERKKEVEIQENERGTEGGKKYESKMEER